MNNHGMLDLVPLYALDALEGEVQRQFETHLETCAECEASLDDHREVSSNLVHDEPVGDETWERISAANTTEGEAALDRRSDRVRSDTRGCERCRLQRGRCGLGHR